MPLSDREETNPEILIAMGEEESSPADQAVLRLDFAEWLDTLEGSRRETAELLASGLNTVDVGKHRGVAGARIAPVAVRPSRGVAGVPRQGRVKDE